MTRRKLTYVFVSAVCLLLGSCLALHAQTDARNASWGSTSAYRTNYPSTGTNSASATSSWGYSPAHNKISAYDRDFGQGAQLSSYFQSTSADALLSDYSSSGVPKGQRRSVLGWGDPEDNPIGEVPNTTPLGEPFALLLLAALYAVRKRKE